MPRCHGLPAMQAQRFLPNLPRWSARITSTRTTMAKKKRNNKKNKQGGGGKVANEAPQAPVSINDVKDAVKEVEPTNSAKPSVTPTEADAVGEETVAKQDDDRPVVEDASVAIPEGLIIDGAVDAVATTSEDVKEAFATPKDEGTDRLLSFLPIECKDETNVEADPFAAFRDVPMAEERTDLNDVFGFASATAIDASSNEAKSDGGQVGREDLIYGTAPDEELVLEDKEEDDVLVMKPNGTTFTCVENEATSSSVEEESSSNQQDVMISTEQQLPETPTCIEDEPPIASMNTEVNDTTNKGGDETVDPVVEDLSTEEVARTNELEGDSKPKEDSTDQLLSFATNECKDGVQEDPFCAINEVPSPDVAKTKVEDVNCTVLDIGGVVERHDDANTGDVDEPPTFAVLQAKEEDANANNTTIDIGDIVVVETKDDAETFHVVEKEVGIGSDQPNGDALITDTGVEGKAIDSEPPVIIGTNAGISSEEVERTTRQSENVYDATELTTGTELMAGKVDEKEVSTDIEMEKCESTDATNHSPIDGSTDEPKLEEQPDATDDTNHQYDGDFYVKSIPSDSELSNVPEENGSTIGPSKQLLNSYSPQLSLEEVDLEEDQPESSGPIVKAFSGDNGLSSSPHGSETQSFHKEGESEAFGFLTTTLRDALGDEAKDVHDEVLCRFIHWKPDVTRAADRFRAYQKFRKDNSYVFDDKQLLLSQDPKLSYLLQNGMVVAPEELVAKDGSSVMIIRGAKCDVTTHDCNDLDASRAIFYTLQQILERGTTSPLVGVTIVLDLVGINRRNVPGKLAKLLSSASGCFPLRIKAIYVVAMPWWFPSGNKRLFSPKLRERIHFVNDRGALVEFIEKDRLLEEDGGIFSFDLQSWISSTLLRELENMSNGTK
eukprot:scaffold5185_cov198-Alexandrium_tamarense.AAC.30